MVSSMGRKTTINFSDEVNEWLMEIRGELIKRTKSNVALSDVVNLSFYLILSLLRGETEIDDLHKEFRERFGRVGGAFIEIYENHYESGGKE